MPSGAKKRKAAKKKKVNNADPATHSHGDDDPKHHDEKESDSGEVSSPSSQDHHNPQHPFAEVEEEEVEKREDTSSVRSFVAENESLEGINYDGESNQEEAREEGDAKIDTELKSEEVFESKSIIIESAKELNNGSSSGSSSSSSSSSDDESHVLEKKTVVIKTAPPVDSAKLADSLSEVATEASESMPIGEVDNSVKETDSVVSSDKFSLLEEVVHVHESDLVDHSMTSGVVVGSGLKENGEKELLSLDENTGVSPVVMDFGSQKKEDGVVSTSEEYATSSSDVKDSAAQVIEEKLLLSVNASNGAEHVQETPECSDSQRLVASAPRTVQTTSWKGCCGIFELFTGSNR